MYTLLWQGFCEDQVKWCIWNYFRNYNALYSQSVIIIAAPNVSSWENLSLKEDEDQVLQNVCDYHYTGEVISQVKLIFHETHTHTSPWSSVCQLSNTRQLIFGYCRSYWPLSYESWLLVQPCPYLAEVIMDKSLKFSAKWQYLFYEGNEY